MNYLINTLIALVLIYIFFLFVIFIFQRNLLYHPSVNNYLKDNDLKKPDGIQKVEITTKDQLKLVAWFYKKNLKTKKTILFFHGNAGSLENRTYKLNSFKNLNVNYLIVAWRGFSGNQGKPYEKGLYEDAESAVRWLKNEGVLEENIILYGESLGTAVAIEIGQNKKYAGIILESPFTSMVNMGKKYYPFAPVSFLLKDKFESYKKVSKIFFPILIIHGKVDKIVPYEMGRKIYELSNDPKFFYTQEYGDHMVEYDEKLLSELNNFIKSLN